MATLQALMTVVIAVGVAIIAFLQWRTAHRKFVLDLFDRRFAVFLDFRKIVSEATQLGKLTDEALPNELVARAKFLFGDDLNAEVERLHTLCVGVAMSDPNAAGEMMQCLERVTPVSNATCEWIRRSTHGRGG